MVVLALDLAIIAIIAFCGWRGYKNGLIRGVFGIVSLVVSLFIASIAANAYSEEFTDMLDPFVGGIVDSMLGEIADADSDSESEPQDNITTYDNRSDSFTTAFTALRRIGLPESPAARVAELAIKDEEGEKPTGPLSELIAGKLSSALAFVAVFGIAFVLLAIIFAVIGNLVGFVFSLPGLKILDIASGVVFGLVKGFLIVFALTTVVRYMGVLAPETIEGTAILKYLVNNNPIADRIGI